MRLGRISPDWTQNIGLLIFHPSIGQVTPVYKDPTSGKGGLLNYHNQSFVTGSTLLTTIANGKWTLTEWQKNHCFLIDVALSIGTLSFLFGDCSYSHGWKTLRRIFIPQALIPCFHDSGMEVDLDGASGVGPSTALPPTVPVKIVVGDREIIVKLR